MDEFTITYQFQARFTKQCSASLVHIFALLSMLKAPENVSEWGSSLVKSPELGKALGW